MAPWLTEVFGIPTGMNEAVCGSFVCYEKFIPLVRVAGMWTIGRATKKL